MNFLKSNKYMNIIIFLFFVYAIFTFSHQQQKINSYNKDIAYYNTQIENLNEEKEELLATEKNVNSPDYIEEVAREKLDMYLPNERVYIDISK